jgi:hypothetical protein
MCLIHNMHLLSMVTGSSQAHIVQAQIVDVHAASVRRTWRLCKALGTPTATRQPGFVHTEYAMNPHIWKMPARHCRLAGIREVLHAEKDP